MEDPNVIKLEAPKKRLTVNDFVESVLAGTFREDNMPAEEKPKEDFAEWKRLGSLYGTDPADEFSKKRVKLAKSPTRKKMQNSPTKLKPLENPKDLKAQVAIEEKPLWYYGSSNAGVPSGNVSAIIKRYGAKSAYKMLSCDERGAGRIREARAENEYVESLDQTPSLWPQNAAYSNGTKLNFRMTRASVAYIPQATSPVKVMKNVRKDTYRMQGGKSEINDLKAAIAIEKRKTNFAHQEVKQKIAEESAARMENTVKLNGLQLYKCKPNFSCASSILWTDKVKVSADRMYRQIDDHNLRKFELKWKCMAVFNAMLTRQSVRQPLSQIIDRIMQQVFDLTVNNFNRFLVNREQFSTILSMHYPNLEQQHISRTYSSFDPGQTNQLDIRHFLATLRLLRSLSSTRKCLKDNFDLYDADDCGSIHYEQIVHLLTLCCSSLDEETFITSKVHQAFQQALPKLHDHCTIPYAVFTKTLDEHPDLVATFEKYVEHHKSK